MSVGTRVVHVVVPEGIDDSRRPSGGNAYDRQLCAGLVEAGWTVHVHAAAGGWPDPGRADRVALEALLADVPDGSTVLLDGLVGSAAPTVTCRHVDRLRLVVLVHLPLGVESRARRDAEGALLARVAAVVATSAWCASWLGEHYGPLGLHHGRVLVAVPGTDPAEQAPGSGAGSALLCVGAVTPIKGYDVLLDALARTAHLEWQMTWVGALDVEPLFVQRLRARAEGAGLAGRLVLTGPLTGADLDAAYRSADALVVASRVETYGMVVTEALARGLPVVACRAGGITEALGTAPDGEVPGLLVPPEDPAALAAAIGSWLADPAVRARARRAAAARRPDHPHRSDTAAPVAHVLASR